MAINKVTGITFNALMLLLDLLRTSFQVYSFKCYGCGRSSIRNCLLPENRRTVNCQETSVCYNAAAYDLGISVLGNKIYSIFIFSRAKKQIYFIYREHCNTLTTHWRCVALSCELIIHNKAKFRSEINGVLKFQVL